MAEELQIAILRAELLDTLRNWGRRCLMFDDSYDPQTLSETLELQRIRMDAMTVELALSRARETKRDFNTVMIEVELEVTRCLGRILSKTLDPAFAGSEEVKVEEDGAVCGVCQEEMKVGDEGRMLGCMHKFHGDCIVKWLRNKATCPLCRYQVQVKEFELNI
ncbi:E3 ubiquitin-protein ligase RNF181 homolog [Juglans microcarpa x Juglans regia]|uniref:E3 ubiquitin-protein ligase RNF181 homolog n=1 Tax=Juglans microcarpa x Juglans regia TaxID=2249226 RepID=UPI001B7D9736|nr:E3 ubiquitin-protein ligase RNF181 homolog [Juglans microcarpa x Juglans regia]